MAVLNANTVVSRGFTFVALKAGDEVPEWAVDQVGDHLVDGDVASTVPDESWKNDEIQDYAAQHGIDLGDATVKADMLAVINES